MDIEGAVWGSGYVSGVMLPSTNTVGIAWGWYFMALGNKRASFAKADI